MEKLSYKLPAFEGPLDLMLFLISKNKLNIYDIQISLLLEQYMESIRQMREENLEVASEFLEMAARLVYIKSESLLPKHEKADELKQELADRLIIYQRCRLVAELLAGMLSFDGYARSPAPTAIDMTYAQPHLPAELLSAYKAAVSRGKAKIPPPADAFEGIMTHEVVSVTSRIMHILRRLRREETIGLRELYINTRSRSELVATFLALLELIKAGRLRIDQTDDGNILIYGGEKFWKRTHKTKGTQTTQEIPG